MTQQIEIPIPVNPDELARKQTLGAAIELCLELRGYTVDKAPCDELGVDKAQFSRWKSGQEGIMWPKFTNLMDRCGNDAPLLWMLMQRGYDIRTLQKVESVYQRRIRELEEKLAMVEYEHQIELRGIQKVRTL